MSQGSAQNQGEKRAALLKVLKATTTMPARVTFYAAALGAILLIPGVGLPPALAAIASSVGVEALGSILERVARGEEVGEDVDRLLDPFGFHPASYPTTGGAISSGR